MARVDLRNRWVLVTGASAGLGREFAQQLAREDGAQLVLVARRRERLDQLAAELEAQGSQAVVISADLARADEVERVFAELQNHGIQLHGALLNAGITHFGEHRELTWESTQNMLATNLQSIVRLTSLITDDMRKNRISGAVMLVSSLAGSTPIPYQSLYSGTKAFVTSFGQALSYELRPDGISITVCAPGGIATEMIASSGLGLYFQSRTAVMSAGDCARLALRAFRRRQSFAIPGRFNQFGSLLARLAGMRATTCILGSVYSRALRVKAAGL